MTTTSVTKKVQVVTGTFVCQAAAYADGDLITDLLTLTPVGTGYNRGGLIQDVTLIDLAGTGLAVDVLIFDANPSGTTFTKNSALDIADADLPKLAAIIELTDFAAFADSGIAMKENIARVFALPANTNTLYACVVARSAPTYASTGDLSIRLGLILDE